MSKKHYCDICGSEIKEHELFIISFSEKDNGQMTRQHRQYDSCPECVDKVEAVIKEK